MGMDCTWALHPPAVVRRAYQRDCWGFLSFVKHYGDLSILFFLFFLLLVHRQVYFIPARPLQPVSRSAPKGTVVADAKLRNCSLWAHALFVG